MSAAEQYEELERQAKELAARIRELESERQRLTAHVEAQSKKPRAWALVRVGAIVAIVMLSAVASAFGWSPACHSRPIDSGTVVALEHAGCFRGGPWDASDPCINYRIELRGTGHVVFRSDATPSAAEAEVGSARVQAVVDRMLEGCFTKLRSYDHRWSSGERVNVSLHIGPDTYVVEHWAHGTCVVPGAVSGENAIDEVAIERGWLPAR